MKEEHLKIATKAQHVLQLENAQLGDEYFYNSLSLCVIDAVFSIGVKYPAVQAVVKRYCQTFGLVRVRPDQALIPDQSDQETITALCKHYEDMEPQRMADEVYRNRQRTSARSGILKADAVLRFSKVLRNHGIEYFQDISSALPSKALERDIRAIPGQTYGTSLQYFWMLAGSDNLVKPDRMISRFLEETLGRVVALQEAKPLITGAVKELRTQYPILTPRLLDHLIWGYQRKK